MKKLNGSVVKTVATNLMEEMGAVTPLEVKEALREAGYQAFQTEVSFYMDELCEDEGWVYDFNDTFRIYRKITDLELLAYHFPRFDN